MVFRNFRLALITRLLLICATLFLFVYLTLHSEFYLTAILTSLVVIVQVYALFRYVDRMNSDLRRFLQSIRYDDFTQTFSHQGRGRSFEELSTALTTVMENIRRTRAEKEEQHHYLTTIVQHIGVGLIAFKPDGKVELINTAAKRLLNVTSLPTIKSLSAISPSLADRLFALKPGDRILVSLDRQPDIIQLAVSATAFRLREEYYTLISIQNIRSELEEKEMEAWQKLIRVLTHEIMNSITPISSLASTANSLLRTTDGAMRVSSEVLNDVQRAVQTIEKRCQGLLHFVDAYRTMTRIPRPQFKSIRIADLFSQVEQLIKPKIEKKQICFYTSIDPKSLELTADPELIEQVLLNLLLNAVQAVHDQPRAEIRLRALTDHLGKVVIEVIDNGPGISEDAREKIFVPFFTTKQDGSGIGLSLSKEIMRLHKGVIRFSSEPGRETVFRLVF
jgi:nitrogen fixation/metabolism regulation signal transduction histidine kinase